jgi:hypothetical protein
MERRAANWASVSTPSATTLRLGHGGGDSVLIKSLLFGSVLLAAATLQAGTVTLITDPADLDANDSVDWSQSGADQSTIPNEFTAFSALGNTISGSFALTNPNGAPTAADSTGQVSVICGGVAPSCSWPSAPGLDPDDTTIWTDNPSAYLGPDNPLTLALSSSVPGVGAWLQADEASTDLGVFTATIAAYDAASDLLGIGTYTVDSDGNGDPVFLGLLDTDPDIASVVFNVTSVPTNGTTDFVLDSLQLTDPTPEPGSLSLLVIGFAGLGWILRKIGRC